MNQNIIMKSGIFIVAVFLAGYSIVNGQSKISIGPTAGFGLSSLSNIAHSKAKLTGNAGISLVYSALEHFGFGMDVNYSFERVRVDYNGGKID